MKNVVFCLGGIWSLDLEEWKIRVNGISPVLFQRQATKQSSGGLLIGVVTAIANACTPFVEWGADHVPQKRMGVFGLGLILIGFALQSIRFWVVVLDVSIRNKWRSV